MKPDGSAGAAAYDGVEPTARGLNALNALGAVGPLTMPFADEKAGLKPVGGGRAGSDEGG